MPLASPIANTTVGHFGAAWKDKAILLISALLAISMWFYVDRIWAPPPEMHYSDLYPRWYGSRELLLHGRDPYGPEVTHEIQLWAYGRPVDTINGTGPRDENRFAYPLYIAFLLAPTVRLPFATVQKFFWTLDPLLALAGICLWLDMLGWRSSRPIWGAVLL